MRKSSFARPDLGPQRRGPDGGALALPARVRGDNYGLVPVQAGLGQILLALVPLATLLLAVLWRQERVRGAAVIGTFFALVGVTLIASDPLRQVPPPLTSVLAVVGGSVCFAQALVIVRWFPPVQPVTMNAVGMTTGALVLLAASMIAGDLFVLPQRRECWLAIGYLVVIGSIAVFLLYLMVLWYWGGDARRVRVRDHRVRDCSAVRMARRRTGHLGLDAWRALGPGGRVYVGALGPGRLKDSSLDPAM